ncbi:hypothetical protein ACFL5J_01535 [Thermodesulfobacteriota bacterium]
MILFDVPFLPDAGYADFLRERADRLHSIHFRLEGGLQLDSRHDYTGWSEGDLLSRLREVPGVRKYALLNSRFYAPGHYFDAEFWRGLIAKLARLAEAGQLDGVVFADHYLLQGLADAAPDLCAGLEAVPSANCLIDSFDGIVAWRQYVAATGFQPPAKIILDRNLNRSLPQLGEISSRCRQQYPDLILTLLGNEGCLYRCPFKLAHDAHIALANTGLTAERCGAMNDSFGCRRYFTAHPEAVLQSPLIRPENLGRYRGLVKVVKLCGRSLGVDFLQRVIDAYLAGAYSGNLLALADTTDWLAEQLYVANELLPEDFFDTLASCDRECGGCRYCRQVLKGCIKKKPLRLKDWRRQGNVL